MHETCPGCGLKFEREPGYFVGAMYVSYALAVAIVGVLTAVLWSLLPRDWPLARVVLVAVAAFLPFVPAVYRWSRVLWIHFDRAIDPDR